MRFQTLLFIAFCLCLLPVSAHESMITIGLRAGAETAFPSVRDDATAHVRFGLGGTGMLDCRYAFYGTVHDYINIGATIGMGLGFGTSALAGTNTDRYRNIDYRNQPIDYTVRSTFRQTDVFGKNEWSVMFAMICRDVVINVGTQFLFPFAASAKMKIKEASVNAYYPRYGVDVPDERITGKLDCPTKHPVSANRSQAEILVAAEVGYQWHMDPKRRLGVQGYVYIGVWNNYRPSAQTNQPLVQVEPILNVHDPIPGISIHSINGQLNGLQSMEVGIRAFYSFTFYSYQKKAFLPYDTRSNHNRYMWR